MKKLALTLVLFSLHLTATTVVFYTENWYSTTFSPTWTVEATTPAAGYGKLYDTNTRGVDYTASRLKFPSIPGNDYSIESSLVCNMSYSGTYHLVHYLRDSSSGYYQVNLEVTTWLDDDGNVNNNGTLVVYKMQSGYLYGLAFTTTTCGTMKSTVSGTQITVQMNGSQIITVSDSTYSTGKPGIGSLYTSTAGSGHGVTTLSFPDTTAPTVPSSLLAAAYSTRVNLSWAASTDDSGIAPTYKIYRGGSFLGSTTQTWFADTTVAAGGTAYSYTVSAVDSVNNESSQSSSASATTLSASMSAPEQEGPVDRYSQWGASPERINLLTTALSLRIPITKYQHRGRGPGFPLALAWNGPYWYSDASGTQTTAMDVGYGEGILIQIASITPIFNGTTIVRYDFQDSGGSFHRLYQVGSTTVWKSQDGSYLSFDTSTWKVTFNDASIWTFACTSAWPEPDAGTMYPTELKDFNGNLITVTYQAGKNQTSTNTSSRISTVVDSLTTYGWTYVSYPSGGSKHLQSIIHSGNSGVSYDAYFTYQSGTVSSPFSGSPLAGQPVTVVQLASMTFLENTVTVPPAFGFTYNSSGEITKFGLPTFGYFRYEYGSQTFANPTRQTREIVNRYISPDGTSGSELLYAFTHPSGDSSLSSHTQTILADASGNHKVWYFTQGSSNGWDNGLESKMETLQGSGNTMKLRTESSWVRDSNAQNPRVNRVDTTLEDGSTKSRREQDTDLNGNVTVVREYGYGSLATPVRTTLNTYVTSTAYVNRNMLNLVSETKVCNGLYTLASPCTGTDLVSDVTVSYDQTIISYMGWPSTQWDSAYRYIFERGTVTSKDQGGLHTTTYYDLSGNPVYSTDQLSHTVATVSYNSGNQVSSVSSGGNNSTLAYNADATLQSATGTNSDSTSLAYDAGHRPTMSYYADGSWLGRSYFNSGSPYWSTTPRPYGVLNYHSSGKQSMTTYDGFGRPTRSMTLEVAATSGGTWITSQTVYAPCSCTPLGRAIKTSRPYRSDHSGDFPSGYTPQWTQSTFDALGRTLTVTTPDGAVTSYDYSIGSHLGSPATVTTITDPVGNKKSYVNDAFGQLLRVDESNSAGALAESARYTYDGLGRMTQVKMGLPKIIVNNNGFESGLTGWTAEGGSNAAVTTSVSHNGTSSLMETGSGVYQDFTGLTVGQVYTVSAWTQVSNAFATLQVDDTTGSNLGFTYTTDTGGAWVLLSLGYTVPSNGKLRVHLKYGSGPGTIYWDNLSVLGSGSVYSQLRTFVYNSKGQLTSSTTPEKGPVTYTYLSDGMLESKTEQTGSKTASPIATKTLWYVYDATHRAIRIESPQGTTKTTFTYDTESNTGLSSTYLAGRMSTASNDGYTWHYSYDIMGRPNKQTLETPFNGSGSTPLMMQSQAGYDTAGNMTDVYYPGAMSEVGSLATGVHYQNVVDLMGRAVSLNIAGGATLASGATYNEASQILGWSEGSTAMSRTYDSQTGRLTNLQANSGSALNLDYGYYANGQVQTVTDHVNPGQSVTSYTYDSVSRLASATASNWGLSFSYDDFGNRTAQTVTAGAPPPMSLTYDATTNQITTANYVYDAGGNLTSFPNKSTTTSVTYDVFNRARTILTGSNTATSKYDAVGRRIQQTLPGGTIRVYFYGMSGQLLAEFDNPVSVPSAPTRVKNYFAGQIIGQWIDRSGSVRKSSAGNDHYYPFGETVSGTANDTAKFAKTYRDSDSGLDYAQARYYSSSIGRFLKPDPSGLHAVNPSLPQKWNRYAYAHSDPINSSDATGLDDDLSETGGLCGPDWAEDASLEGPCDSGGGGGSPGGGIGGGGSPFLPTRDQELNSWRNLIDAAAASTLAYNLARNPSGNVKIPAGLVMTGECWSPATGASLSYTLQVTYQIVSSSGSPMSGADLAGISISENLRNIVSTSDSAAARVKDTQSTWVYGTPFGIQPNGTFTDFLSAGGIAGLGADPWQAFQSFTANGFLSNGIPLVAQPLEVSGFGSPTTVLSDSVGTSNATINGFGVGTNPVARCKN